MARLKIDKIIKIDKQRNSVHEEVVGTYTTFESDGEKYLQIDTYGKSEREMPEKISQSFQFNLESAKYIVNLLNKEFNL